MQYPDKDVNSNIFRWFAILLLAGIFFCGIRIFRDYGASSDEINQIQAGHITWTAICERLGKQAPDFGNLPKLKDYYNRYYGQAATFPTVVYEALNNFTLDISTILRIRHIWNFAVYFIGLICFSVLIKLHYKRDDVVFFLLLIHVLTPRLFGDAFYNDRDVMLISLLWISLLCYDIYYRRSGILTASLCAFFFAIAINTRFFALILLLFPIVHFFRSNRQKKRYDLLIIVLTVFFWYLFTPLFWGNFTSGLIAAFQTFATGKQRTQETGGMANILFFGTYYPENALPFYYLPLWIFISTPIIPQILAVIGLIQNLRSNTDLMCRFMSVFLCLGILIVMLVHPVLYNGWRHMYFLYVPLFWLAACGLKQVFTLPNKIVRGCTICLLLISALWTTFRIVSLHPYEYIYLNPLYQSRLSDFDRDYWRLSTKECLEWLEKLESTEFSVGEINENLDNSLIALLPNQRNQIVIRNYNALHWQQPDYLIFNYSGMIGNNNDFPLYERIHAVERDSTKLAEVYKRIFPISVSVLQLTPEISQVIDNDMHTEWRSEKLQNPEEDFIFEFSEGTSLVGVSILPGENEQEYAHSPEISISSDGKNWTPLTLTISGLFDFSFPRVTTKWLRIRNTDYADFNWSIREIYFY